MTQPITEESTYQEKLVSLAQWMPEIMTAVKKDLRQEHLSQDRLFANKYFAGKQVNKLSIEDMAAAYSNAIQVEEKKEEIAEFICHKWLLKNSDLYDFFERELSKIATDFTTLTSLPPAAEQNIKKNAIAEFGAIPTYIFSIINTVVFSEEALKKLRHEAQLEQTEAKKEFAEKQEAQNWEKKVQNLESQLARIEDRYEKKLAGLERKYERDVGALKKQVANLQRQIQG